MAGSLSVEAILSALVDVAFRDGRAELKRAEGQRGIVRLELRLVLGDHGRPQESTSLLAFEGKRHIKDAFAARETNGNG